MTGRVVVLRGDAAHLPLPDGSVDLIVTSPPFLNLRSYTDGGEHYDGQIGTGTRTQFLDDLWECTAEMARVLKPSGSIFVELGDSYTDKCLNDTPARYSIGCVDKLGLIKRANIIWHKVSAQPESVTDRCATRHEYLFHFTKQPHYFTAIDEIREAVQADHHTLSRRDRTDRRLTAANAGQTSAANPLGKLPGSVWEIPSQPLVAPAALGIDHFAAFPMELPRRIILGWSPSGICVECGEGRRPVAAAAVREPNDRLAISTRARTSVARGTHAGSTLGYPASTAERRITGYACACPDASAPTRPAVVLDPFGGTGTTSLVASVLGRIGITIDRSADYCRFARWRTADPGERARALGVPKPPPVPDGQESLFDLGEAS